MSREAAILFNDKTSCELLGVSYMLTIVDEIKAAKILYRKTLNEALQEAIRNELSGLDMYELTLKIRLGG